MVSRNDGPAMNDRSHVLERFAGALGIVIQVPDDNVKVRGFGSREGHRFLHIFPILVDEHVIVRHVPVQVPANTQFRQNDHPGLFRDATANGMANLTEIVFKVAGSGVRLSKYDFHSLIPSKIFACTNAPLSKGIFRCV